MRLVFLRIWRQACFAIVVVKTFNSFSAKKNFLSDWLHAYLTGLIVTCFFAKATAHSRQQQPYYAYIKFARLAHYHIVPMPTLSENLDEAQVDKRCYSYKYYSKGKWLSCLVPNFNFCPVESDWHVHFMYIYIYY